MSINYTKLLSGRAPVVGYSNLTADRYQFLALGQAEPNLGPGNANSVLTLSTSNSRVWSNALSLTTVSVSGNVKVSNVTIVDTTFTSVNVGGNIIGFAGTAGIVIPAGGNSQRPLSPSVGTTRFNTFRDALETWDGTTWVLATGSGGGGNIVVPGVVVDQQITPDGITDTYALYQATTTTNVLVTINGVSQLPGTAYNVAGNSITFASVPLTTDEIDIRFLAYAVSLNSMSNESGNTSITILPQSNAASNIIFTTSNVVFATMTSNIFNINFPVSVAGNITATNIIGNIANSTYANSAGTAVTVTANAQPNITSVGILNSVSVSGNANIGAVTVSGNISTTGYILTSGTISTSGNIIASNHIGNGA